ncbi:MAG: competence/damage-inducible protein A [Senegalia sp. (in: firmicutes)]|uniref:competence/damage-inducible protein A n=1 Tax=Senegalia sp. (in: firmicutes) TaxID=1924098 RepID=UPI003F9E15F5
MKAIVINIGDEILDGDILNTNSMYISKELKNINITVEKIYVIKDEINSIIKTTKSSLQEADIIIFTGGLGPTDDDMTREGVSKALGYDIYLDDELLISLEELFKKSNFKMTKNNIKQAYRIKNSTIIKNKNGTAPGMFLNKDNKMIFLLPGPPKELKPMFDEVINNYLYNISNTHTYTKVIKTIGIGESQLEEKIKPFFNDNIKIGMYAHNATVDIKVSSSNKSLDKSKEYVFQFINSISIKNFIWGYDNDKLENIVLNLLKKHNLKIGFAESLTGGLISSNFTKLSGVSEVFPLSLVTYSNDSKINFLNVEKEDLNRFGAVSKEVAIQMSKGLINKYNLDIALAVTGIAGPTGDTKDKPIGLVYIAIAGKENYIYKKFIFKGDRNTVQNKTSLNSFNELRKFILKFYQ